MTSRNIVVMQKNGGGDCIVSRVKKVHQGFPYHELPPIMSQWYAPLSVDRKLQISHDQGKLFGNSVYMITLAPPIRRIIYIFICRQRGCKLWGTKVTTSIRLC